MTTWLPGVGLLVAMVTVEVVVQWLRHRPHRLTQPTQHIVLAGMAVQFVLMAITLAWIAVAVVPRL